MSNSKDEVKKSALNEKAGKEELFASWRFTGPRFNGPSLPVDVLQDLAVYKKLILEVAKSIFLQKNPERKRVPKGFSDAFSLELSGLESGSSVALLKIPDEGVGDKILDEYLEAREVVSECIGALNEGRRPSADFPNSALRLVSSMGQRLREGEAIQISQASRKNPVTFSSVVRDRAIKLVLQTRALGHEEVVEGSKAGTIVNANINEMTFELEVSAGARIQGRFNYLTEDTILDALNNYHRKVKVKGIIRKNNRGEEVFSEVLDVEEEEDSDYKGPNFEKRLEVLASLNNGWLDGQGLAPAPDLLSKAGWTIRRILRGFHVSAPHIFPNEDGGIELQWRQEPWFVVAVFEVGEDEVFCSAYNRETKQSLEAEFDYKSADFVRDFGRYIYSFSNLPKN